MEGFQGHLGTRFSNRLGSNRSYGRPRFDPRFEVLVRYSIEEPVELRGGKILQIAESPFKDDLVFGLDVVVVLVVAFRLAGGFFIDE